MGNAHASNRKGAKHVVTVLQGDGRVMEFPRPMRVADLLEDFPDHFVCHSSALVLMNQGKMLPANALLMRGEVYFLLPFLRSQSSLPASIGAENDPLLASGQPREAGKVGGTMKVLITKQQLAKILAEGSIKIAAAERELAPPLSELKSTARTSSDVRVLHRPSPSLIRRAVTWSPGLESISEVPVM